MPTLEEVRDHAASGHFSEVFADTSEFDHWLAEHDAEVVRAAAQAASEYVQSVTFDRKYGHDLLWVGINVRGVGRVVQEKLGYVPVELNRQA